MNRMRRCCAAIMMTGVITMVCSTASSAAQIQGKLDKSALLSDALAAKPPRENGPFKKPDLVELITLDKMFHLDIRYATPNNFTGVTLYSQARAFLERPAAYALVRVQQALARHGYGLLIFDGYRPWYVTRLFWEVTPADKHQFVADPAEGSRHNRGCAVDLSLYDLKTGREITMPSAFDEMSPRAYADYADAPPEQKAARDRLRDAMTQEGFVQLPEEWWHFDYKDWANYPIQNIKFEEIPK